MMATLTLNGLNMLLTWPYRFDFMKNDLLRLNLHLNAMPYYGTIYLVK